MILVTIRKNRLKKVFKKSIKDSTELESDLENTLSNSLTILIEDDLPKEFIDIHKNGFNIRLKPEYKEDLEQCLNELFHKLKTRALKQALRYNN